MDSHLVLPDNPERGSLTAVTRTALTAFTRDGLGDAWQRGHDVTFASFGLQHKGDLLDRFCQALLDGIADAISVAPEGERENLKQESREHLNRALAELRESLPNPGTQIKQAIKNAFGKK